MVCTDPRVVAELIPDGAHVHPLPAAALPLQGAGRDRPGHGRDALRRPAPWSLPGWRADAGDPGRPGLLDRGGQPGRERLAHRPRPGRAHLRRRRPPGRGGRMGSTVPAQELGLGRARGACSPATTPTWRPSAPSPGPAWGRPGGAPGRRPALRADHGGGARSSSPLDPSSWPRPCFTTVKQPPTARSGGRQAGRLARSGLTVP